MASNDTETSTLTSIEDLTEIHAQSDLTTIYESRRTKSGFIVGEGRTSGYKPTPPAKKRYISWIWKHGEPITRVRDGQTLWMCRNCFNNNVEGLVVKAANPTTTAQRHMVDFHDYDFQGNYVGKQTIPAKRKSVLDAIHKQNKAQNTSFDRTAFEGLYATWALTTNQSLRQATSSTLRELITLRDPFVEDVLPASHNSLAS